MLIFTWDPPQPAPPVHYPDVDGQEVFLYLGDVLIITDYLGAEASSWPIPVNAPGTYHVEVWATYDGTNGLVYSELSASDDFTIQWTPKSPQPSDPMVASPSGGDVSEGA